jgi:hypothetical protein
MLFFVFLILSILLFVMDFQSQKGSFTSDPDQQNISIVSGNVWLLVSISNFSSFLTLDPIRSYQNLTIATNETEDIRGKLFVVPPDDNPADLIETLLEGEVAAILAYRTVSETSVPVIVASAADHPRVLQFQTVSIVLDTTNPGTLYLAGYSSMGRRSAASSNAMLLCRALTSVQPA